MKISTEAANKLYDDLPPGFAKVLQERILEKLGKHFSLRMIYAVIQPGDERYNEVIIDEAILYRNELLKKNNDREEDILSPK